MAQALSAVYADVLEIAPTDVFANVGGFTIATVAGITTITVPNSGLFKLSCSCKDRDCSEQSSTDIYAG